MPWSLACDQYGRCITLPETFPLKTFHLYNRSSGKVLVPSLPTCSSRSRQPHPSFALGGCWGQLAWRLHDTRLGQSLLQEKVCNTGPAQRVQDWVLHMMGWQVRDPQATKCLTPLGLPGPCSSVAESSARSNARCLGFCPSLHPNRTLLTQASHKNSHCLICPCPRALPLCRPLSP